MEMINTATFGFSGGGTAALPIFLGDDIYVAIFKIIAKSAMHQYLFCFRECLSQQRLKRCGMRLGALKK